ncbi:MAG: hypothetical protein GF313_12975 [Caldithrix sp.]|nr:hypothetical protein [Caldithrix sp.]
MKLFKSAKFNGNLLIAIVMVILTTYGVQAQLIEIRSVPVATGNQFSVFPSQNQSMAGVSIAIDDPWQSPFMNPAKGTEMDKTRLFFLPNRYSISDLNESGHSLPLALHMPFVNWYGSLLLSTQELNAPNNASINQPWNSYYTPAKTQSRKNSYAQISLGRKLHNNPNTSLGISVFYADLQALSGVDYLYNSPDAIQQNGQVWDFRIGTDHRFADQKSVELLVLYNRFKMKHTITQYDWRYEDRITTHDAIYPYSYRVEKDQTNTTGLHVKYQQPLKENSPWMVGGVLTVNRKSHPKIPNYELMNIPRDPGDSWAYNFGIGLAKEIKEASLALDLIYEPIWSFTWADALNDIERSDGSILPAGGVTVDNHFRFSNYVMRIGVSEKKPPLGIDFGFELRQNQYDLTQENYIELSKRHLQESWTELTFTWGISLLSDHFQVLYSGRAVFGTGLPGTTNGGAWRFGAEAAAMSSSNFIIAPDGNLNVRESAVLFHRLTLSVPLGG